MLIKGIAWYARVTGEPHVTEFSPNGEWSFDLQVDEETATKLLEAGMKKSYLKTSDRAPEKGTFLTFVRKAIKSDGGAGKPYQVFDNQGQPWPDNKIIGNGSKLNVIVMMSEREYRKEKFLKPSCLKIQIWEHVPYVSNKSAGSEFPVKEGVELPDNKEW